jgi:hypothetical protein
VIIWEVEPVFDQFPKYHLKILLRDFNVKLRREYIFNPTAGDERLHEISNYNGVRVVYFAISKRIIIKSTMFPHRNIHKYTRTYPDGKKHNQIYNVSKDIRWDLNIFDLRSFR